jgi:hypothetical protein
MNTGELYAELHVTTGKPTVIGFRPDGKYLYYEDYGGALRRFPRDDTELLQLAKDRVTRQLTPEECARYEIECPPAA